MTKMKRAISFLLALLILSVLLLSLFSCTATYKFKEMGITLPSSFKEAEVPREVFDKAYSDGEMIVGFTRMSFYSAVADNLPETLTPRRFAEYYIERAVIYTEIKNHGLVPYCIYSLGEGENKQSFLLSFYRTSYAYFVITFSVVGEFTSERCDEVFGYIDTVYYTE